MTAPAQNIAPDTSWSSLEPYAQLIRSLLPRAISVTLFDPQGELTWSSETTTGPDLIERVESTLSAAQTETDNTGLVQMLDGGLPLYLCFLRDDESRLLAILAIVCRALSPGEGAPRAFSFVHALLRPALECLRRDLLARTSIAGLKHAMSELDRDVQMLLADGAQSSDSPDSADELKALVQGAVEHLRCAMAALIVPDKSIAILRATRDCRPDGAMLLRTHRQLVSMAQMRKDPVIINRVTPVASMTGSAFRILSCPVRSANERTIGVLALFRDPAAPEFIERDARLTEVLARRAAALVLSQYDALTGLHTRAALEKRSTLVIAERGPDVSWSVLYVDADQLHVINESFGMHVGDTVLAQLGELIRTRLPPGAVAARLAGDRFAVLVPLMADEASKLGETLRAGAELLGAAHAAGDLKVAISIGIAPLEGAGASLSHALATAETACKAAKDGDRNRVVLFQSNDTTIVGRFADVNVAARLRAAIAGERLRLDAQLIVPFDTSGPSRPQFELLLRMIGEDGTTLGPDSFLTAANRYQLMPAIDRWVIQRTLALLHPQAEVLASLPASFTINLSGQSLAEEGFADFLLGALETSGLDPRLFCFDFTESATMLNLARSEALIRRLRRIGCGVALDDFGTGLSSLAYLRQLSVTQLKIDGSFVRDVLKDPRAESMVRAIAQLARGMSIVTVAECVETEEVRARIATLGVDYGQGFAIGRPWPFTEVLTQLPILAAAAAVPSQVVNLR